MNDGNLIRGMTFAVQGIRQLLTVADKDYLYVVLVDRLDCSRYGHFRSKIPPHSIEGDLHDSLDTTSTIFLPLYVPQLEHTRCGCFISLQSGHSTRTGDWPFQLALLLSLLVLV